LVQTLMTARSVQMNGAKDITARPARFEAGLPMLIAGLSERYGFDRRGEIPRQWARFAPYIGAVENQIAAAAFGAMSLRANGFDYMSGVHVWDADDLPNGFSVLRVPARRYAVFPHKGHVSSLADTVRAIMHEWLPESGFALDGAPELVEVYGESFNLTAGAGDIEVWVAVRSPASTYTNEREREEIAMSVADIEKPQTENELVLTRLLDAPRAALFRCWTEPALAKQWFAPKPWTTEVAEMDPRAGGVFHIVMRGPDGESSGEASAPGIFLEVVKDEKIVFTDAFRPGWIPAGKPFMAAEVTFTDEGGKTRYTARARHWSAEDRDAHVKMGFHEGWGICADQLEALAKTL
jgi:uncharacterized protein YndB with AHSA1/START domain/predicted transcriptional regulator YdeE